MSTSNSNMKAADKLRTAVGSNIAASMARPGELSQAIAANLSPARSGDQDRFVGLGRIKNAFLVPLDRIAPDPNQPRKEFEPEALERLAESLKERGQLQPIRIRWDATMNRWTIIAGERRWRAAALAGMTTIAAVEASQPLSEDEVLEDQLVENCVRSDLLPVEQARAFKTLMDSRGWSAIRLAKVLSLDDSTVIRALALLNLPCTVQEQVESGSIAPSVAYEISKVDDPATQADLAARVVAEGLTRSETVAAVKRVSKPSGSKGRGVAKGKARKITSRVFRTTGGARFTVERSKGLDAALIRDGLVEILSQIDAELGTDDQAAA
jgi:ParB family chromosome partitioning protein